jgi:hypothetical protein
MRTNRRWVRFFYLRTHDHPWQIGLLFWGIGTGFFFLVTWAFPGHSGNRFAWPLTSSALLAVGLYMSARGDGTA